MKGIAFHYENLGTELTVLSTTKAKEDAYCAALTIDYLRLQIWKKINVLEDTIHPIKGTLQ